MGLEKDLPPGEQLVACFRPFIEHLASSSLSPKTIRRHVDNLWLLGGEIIRDLNYDPSQRKVAVHKLLRDAIGAHGGPLISCPSYFVDTFIYLPRLSPPVFIEKPPVFAICNMRKREANWLTL